MTLPTYGRQLIRFAETFYVKPSLQVNSYRVVVLDTPLTSPSMPLHVKMGNGAAVGISQFQVADNDPATGFATDELRTLTVATSGLLLVQADSSLVTADVGTALYATAAGVATDSLTVGGAAVTINGATPTIREIVSIGPTPYVLISI
jgi:hypothetical protein